MPTEFIFTQYLKLLAMDCLRGQDAYLRFPSGDSLASMMGSFSRGPVYFFVSTPPNINAPIHN